MDGPEASERARRLLSGLVAEGAIDGAVAAVGDPRRLLWQTAVGGAQTTARFDLASLTKPLIGTLAGALHRRGQWLLSARVGDLAPASGPLARRRLGDLLRHRSHLMAWTPFYARCRAPGETLPLILSGALSDGAGERYSDIGFVLWGLLAARGLEVPLDDLVERWVLGPLGAREAFRRAPDPDGLTSALGDGRELELAASQGLSIQGPGPPGPGEAQDGNARFLGPSAAHAGWFGSAEGLWRLGREWLLPERVLDPETLRDALRGGRSYALGWWRRRVRGSAGPALSPTAFGMVGFTGGSLWIDPARNVVAVLLARRRRLDVDLAPTRRRFHALAVASLEGSR